MFAKFIVSIICFLFLLSRGAMAVPPPTAYPTVGVHDVQENSMGWYSGVAVGPERSAVYLIGADSGGSAILKCPTTTIAHDECTTIVASQEEAFYTAATYQTKVAGGGPNSKFITDDMNVYGTGNIYGGNLYFLDGSNYYVFKCTAVSKCYKYMDLNTLTIGSISGFSWNIMDMDASGNMYFSDGQSDIYKCTDATTCTDTGITGMVGIISFALDSTGANLYVYDRTTSSTCTIFKCSTAGSCTTYLSPTTSIGKALDGTTDLVLSGKFTSSGNNYDLNVAVGVDPSGNVYLSSANNIDGDGTDPYMSRYQCVDVYKCTAKNMCSIYLDGASFYPFATDDDGHSLRFVYNSMKFDSAGFMYFSTYEKIYRYGNGAWSTSSSSSTLNSKMYGIIVLALFPFAAFFACGYFFAKHRLGYTKAPTKETEMSHVSHTAV